MINIEINLDFEVLLKVHDYSPGYKTYECNPDSPSYSDPGENESFDYTACFLINGEEIPLPEKLSNELYDTFLKEFKDF